MTEQHGVDQYGVEQRRVELAANIADVRARIGRAELDAGREPGSVTLIGVTKTRPASDVLLLAELGVGDVGESRDQEAAAKRAECAGAELCWHMVGRLQTNKARSVAAWAEVVHSVDRIALVNALAEGAAGAGRTVGVCLQVSLDGDPDRGGAVEDELPGLAAAVRDRAGLVLRGLMAVAPLQSAPPEAFLRLATIWEDFRAEHPDVDLLSAGMSGDLEPAIAAGATHVRVGTALLGARAPHVG